MISVTPSRTSWTLLDPEDGNTSVDCFTTTTRNIPCFQFGTANTNSILRRGPKHMRASLRKVSFHLKTQESIGTKSKASSITSVKKQETHSDSELSARNLRKSSTSTTCSKSTSPTTGQEPRLPNQVDLMQRSPLMQNCRQLPCLTPLTESELQGLCASILTETFPEVCITDTVIPDPCEHKELDPTALQWRDPTSKTFSPSSQLVAISLATMHQFSGVSSPTPLWFSLIAALSSAFLNAAKYPKSVQFQPLNNLSVVSLAPRISLKRSLSQALCSLSSAPLNVSIPPYVVYYLTSNKKTALTI